jgi:MOSC domain-containing protein YiiM
MKLISVNIGRPRPVPHEGRVVSTGIFKEPVAGPVFLRRLNLDGDGQADLRVHGGADKAVYAYPFEHYAFWEQECRNDFKNPLSLEGEGGRSSKRAGFPYGQFGENFTITGWLEDAVCIGDEFQIGAARVQVTQPRPPCFKLGIRMNDDQFPARFAAANRTGFYLRVLQEGRISAGDAIERVAHDAGSLSVRDVFRLRHDRGTRAEYERAARLPALSPSWRAVFEKRLVEAK